MATKATATTKATAAKARTRPGSSANDPGPTVFVLYGATGDLAKRMVLPAFYRLAVEGLLPEGLAAGRQRPRRRLPRGLPPATSTTC